MKYLLILLMMASVNVWGGCFNGTSWENEDGKISTFTKNKICGGGDCIVYFEKNCNVAIMKYIGRNTGRIMIIVFRRKGDVINATMSLDGEDFEYKLWRVKK